MNVLEILILIIFTFVGVYLCKIVDQEKKKGRNLGYRLCSGNLNIPGRCSVNGCAHTKKPS